MKVLDLFSGIGGFSIGLERAGMETVAFCEIEPYCRAVLKKHWPDIPCYEDIRDLAGEQIGAVDVICGGFPCQDISRAGKQAGIAGERSGLWREFARLIGEIQPRYAIIENVSALLADGMGRVLSDLAAIRYDAEWHCIPASYAGLRQLRDRVWIVAYPECNSIQGRAPFTAAWQSKTRAQQLAGLLLPVPWPTVSGARNSGSGHGIPNGIHRNTAIGNAVIPQIPEMIGRAIMSLDA